jgi:hypothetical protein
MIFNLPRASDYLHLDQCPGLMGEALCRTCTPSFSTLMTWQYRGLVPEAERYDVIMHPQNGFGCSKLIGSSRVIRFVGTF